MKQTLLLVFNILHKRLVLDGVSSSRSGVPSGFPQGPTSSKTKIEIVMLAVIWPRLGTENLGNCLIQTLENFWKLQRDRCIGTDLTAFIM